MKRLVIIILILVGMEARASTTTYRDSRGRVIMRSTTTGGTTTHRDAQGKVIYRTDSQGTTRDAQGRIILKSK